MSRNHWITLHRLRFAAPVDARARSFAAPEGVDCWRFCPELRCGPDGLPTFNADVWAGIALHETRAGAEAMIADPATALPFLSEAVEDWHALAVPVAHRGAVNWRGTVETDAAVRPAEPVAGPLVMVTTAGYLSRDAATLPRIRAFCAGLVEVLADYATRPGNLRRGVFTGGFDGRDGFTISVWSDDRAMAGAAYQPGTHQGMIARQKTGEMADRTSFTRARLLAQRGSWDGDPMAA
jgi:hypothetical protein